MTRVRVLAGGRVIDPLTGYFGPATVFISDGKIERVEKRKKSPLSGRNVLDLRGLLVCPGLIDMHVHLREPGREDEETIISGAEAAVAGGFTSVVCMPNTQPPIDNAEAIKFVLERARMAPARVYPIGAVTVGRRGEVLTEMKEMRESGAVGFSDDGSGLQNNDLMRRAIEYASSCNVPVISHCEYSDLAAGGVMNESFTSTVLGLRGIPSMAEELMVAREIMLAGYTGGRVHIAHVSTAGSVELIRRAKRARIKITAEVTPHHLTLADDAVRTFDTNLKVNPPLRSRADIEALKKGLRDGTIDAIASDHAPHAVEEKEAEFDDAPFGMIGLETTLGIIASELVGKKVLSWPEAIAKLTVNPARILNLAGGTLEPGAPADITVINPNLKWTVKEENFKSLSRNSPLVGRQLRGKAVMTIVGGRVAYSSL